MLTEGRPQSRWPTWARRTAGVLFLVPFLGVPLLVANLFLTFLSWKLAAVVDVAIAGGAALAWWRSTESSWVFRAVLAVAAGVTAIVAALAWPIWRDHAAHDARLATMTDELCAIDLPDGAERTGSCTGSITNTGNGNSCLYTASVPVATSSMGSLREHLERQGFLRTRLDFEGRPSGDGFSYLLQGPGEARLYYVSSWQENGQDLRCT